MVKSATKRDVAEEPAVQSFRKNMRKLMDDQGLNARSLALKLGVNNATTWRIVQGKNGLSMRMAIKIAKALGVNLEDMLKD